MELRIVLDSPFSGVDSSDKVPFVIKDMVFFNKYSSGFPNGYHWLMVFSSNL